MSRILRIGTRGSKLALAQTRAVVSALERANPGTGFDVVVIKTQGDRSGAAGTPFGAGVGVFVREIERALVEGRVDVAVHSLKDVPTDLAPGTSIAAMPKRADARDVLVSRGGLCLADLPMGGKVGTSSARRRAQILMIRPDLEAVPIRGNVDTRLRKVTQGENGLSAIVLAAAGLARLGWKMGTRRYDSANGDIDTDAQEGAEPHNGHVPIFPEYLPVDRFPPCAGQGAVAVQARADDAEANGLAAKVDHPPTRAACETERAFIAALGAGCRTPVGAYATVDGDTLKITGAVYSEDGADCICGEGSGPMADAETIGAGLAESLGAKGAYDLVARTREQVG